MQITRNKFYGSLCIFPMKPKNWPRPLLDQELYRPQILQFYLFLNFIYLKRREERQGERQIKTKLFHLLAHAPDAYNSLNGPGKRRESESNLALPYGSHQLLPPRLRVGQKVKSEMELGLKRTHCKMGFTDCSWCLDHCAKHPSSTSQVCSFS